MTTPQVDPEDRDPCRCRQARARKEGTVAAERHDQAGAFRSRLGTVAPRLHGLGVVLLGHLQSAVDDRLLGARATQKADLHAPAPRRWKKTSRLPSAPATSDWA